MKNLSTHAGPAKFAAPLIIALSAAAAFAQKDYTGVVFTQETLPVSPVNQKVMFNSDNLTDATLVGLNLAAADFGKAALLNTDFFGSDISRAIFQNSKYLTGAQIASTANYAKKDLSGITFTSSVGEGQADFTGLNMDGFNLKSTSFSNVIMTGASFVGADLEGAAINMATTLSFADGAFAGANVKNVIANATFTLEHLQSTASWARKDLGAINLSGVKYAGADFSGFNLKGMTASGSADLRGASLSSSDLTDKNTVIYKNTIDTDGVIRDLSMVSETDLILVREYADQNAVLASELETSGGSTIEIASGGILDVQASLSMGSNLSFVYGEIGFGKLIANGAEVSFGENAAIVIDFGGASLSDLEYALVETVSGGSFSGLDGVKLTVIANGADVSS